MLANAFKSPADLKITDAKFEALVKLLGMLERGELVHVLNPDKSETKSPFGFNMEEWDCGTAACIGGWVERILGAPMNSSHVDGLENLFFPGLTYPGAYYATPAQAAIAIRNYLTTGEPNWGEAMAS